ncbi:MAG: response regulator transcription factor [Bacteroidales bacterium]|nr:response regulator transcription factor [Bacteroidales bacterium]
MENKVARILYVEDDETLSFITIDNLTRKGFEVIHAENGLDAMNLFSKEQFDICLFDVMLPKMDGFDLAHKVRSVNQEIPILFITAKTLPEDRIKGLLIGADDYITKPYTMEELILRIKVFLKRKRIVDSDDENNISKISATTINWEDLKIITNNKEQKITYREAELLKFFIENKNTVITRERILNVLWGENDYFAGRSLDVFITRLRKYFKSDSKISIENKHGVGFIFKVNE